MLCTPGRDRVRREAGQRLRRQMSVDITVAKPHHSGYGASARPLAGLTAAVRRVRSALLAVRAAAARADAPSLCCLKNSQLQPALRTRLVANAAAYERVWLESPLSRSVSRVRPELTAMSV